MFGDRARWSYNRKYENPIFYLIKRHVVTEPVAQDLDRFWLRGDRGHLPRRRRRGAGGAGPAAGASG